MNQSGLSNEIYIDVSGGSNLRLDAFLAEEVENLSRSKLRDLILNGNVLVNGKVSKPSYHVKDFDKITVKMPSLEPLELIPEEIHMEFLYEDDYFLAVNKPPGIVVHPGAGNREGTLVSGLLNYTDTLSTLGGTNRPGLVHRLDKNTSGVLIVAKTDEAHWKLGALFAERKIYKEYRALVWGIPCPTNRVIETYLTRNPRNRQKYCVSNTGKFARSRYETIESFGIITYVKVIIETGRTHQIRIHMQYVGHPVVSDATYGGGKRYFGSHSKQIADLGKQIISRTNRQMLHAHCIRFRHPFLGRELEIKAPLADDIESNLEILRNASKRDE